MVIRRRVAVSNPHRPKKKRKNPKKMSAKQIKFFGSKRQRAALKSKRRKKANPKVRTRTRVVVKKIYVRAKTKRKNPRKRIRVAKRRRRTNPQIISLGLLNPSKGRVKVTKRKKSTRRRVAHRNPKRRVVVKKSYHAKGHRRRTHRRHNPGNVLGSGKRVIAALGGFAAMKIARGFVPASLASGSQAMSVAIDFGLAIAVGMLAKKFVPASAEDVQLGALITASNTAINTFFPSLSQYTGMSGFGIYQNARFAVPENPITRGYVPPAPPSAKGGVGLLQGRSF